MIDGPVIQTASGVYVSPLYPYEWEPNIHDIAHALSQLNRFTGHTSEPYSVAEHSVRVADLCPPQHKLAALLHDASEAYLGDLASPLKHHPFFGEAYRSAERALQNRIYEHFGVSEEPACVKEADLIMLATEKRDLMPAGPEWKILEGVKPVKAHIDPWTAFAAKREFLSEFAVLSRLGVAA